MVGVDATFATSEVYQYPEKREFLIRRPASQQRCPGAVGGLRLMSGWPVMLLGGVER